MIIQVKPRYLDEAWAAASEETLRVEAPVLSAVELDRLDDPAWDPFVEAHPLGWVCHLSSWRQVVEEAFPHITGHLLVIREGAAIRAGLPVYTVKSLLTGKRVVSIPFATLCHPLVRDPEDTSQLLNAVLELSRSNGSRYLELRTMRPLETAAAGQFAMSTCFKHHHLALDRSTEELRKRFDRSCVRQRIDRAVKSGVEAVTVVDERGLGEFYALYVRTRGRLGLPPQPYRFIRSLWTTFSSEGRLEVQLARYKGRPIAGILLLRFNGRVSAEFLVSDESQRDVSPNQLLVWNAIRQAHEQGFRIFDFGRTHVTNTSLMDFKRRWGTEVTDLPIYFHPKSRLDTMERQRAELRPALQWTLQHLPEAGNRLLGEFIYRHMG